MHDDCFGRSYPPLYLRNGRGHGARARLDTPTPRLAPLGEVLVHVLGEVAEQGELLVQGGGDMLGRHRAHTAPLAELDVAENKESKWFINHLIIYKYFWLINDIIIINL